jgi:acyl-CoA synthetase (AMP-forming)/AMP-acid ligase II
MGTRLRTLRAMSRPFAELNYNRTAETFVDGWVRTGDEVVIKNQEVFIVDRLKVGEFLLLMFLDFIS